MKKLNEQLTNYSKRIGNFVLLSFQPVMRSFTDPLFNIVYSDEVEVVNTIRRLVDIPQALDTGELADGMVQYTGIRIDAASPMVGLVLKLLSRHMDEDALFITQREGMAWCP